MSVAYARPLPTRAPERHPRHIEIVTTRAQRKARPRVAYAVFTVASLFAIFGAQLLLSIVVSNGAYEIDALQAQQKELLRTEQALQEQLATLDSTQNLAAQAAHLGMVPNGDPYAIDLSTGSVFALPGSADPTGCGGSCNLVANSLLTGVPLVNPASPAQHAAAPAMGTPPAKSPAVVDALPAPVTH
jgi:cell division protein FtsB